MTKFCNLSVAVSLALVSAPSQTASAQAAPEPVYRGKSVGAWIKEATHRHPAVRHKAVTTLGNMPPAQAKAAVPVLILACSDEDSRIRSASAFAPWRASGRTRRKQCRRS
jgi:hypothetical protein